MQKALFGNLAIMTYTVLDPRLCVPPLSKGLPFLYNFLDKELTIE